MPDLLKASFLMGQSVLPQFFSVTDENGRAIHTLLMDPEVWEDMGSPSEITVTIEPGDTLNEEPDGEPLARRFHEAYERLAPSFGYETREASAVPWDEVPEPNRSLMIAVAAEVQRHL